MRSDRRRAGQERGPFDRMNRETGWEQLRDLVGNSLFLSVFELFMAPEIGRIYPSVERILV